MELISFLARLISSRSEPVSTTGDEHLEWKWMRHSFLQFWMKIYELITLAFTGFKFGDGTNRIFPRYVSYINTSLCLLSSDFRQQSKSLAGYVKLIAEMSMLERRVLLNEAVAESDPDL